MLRTEGPATTGGRHSPRALGDGPGRHHRRSLRPQPLQGHPHPSQRPEGEEEAETDPRVHLRGNAPLRQGCWPLRGNGEDLHRHRYAPRRGPPLRPETSTAKPFNRTAHEGRILEGTKTDHGEEDAGRVVPVPATLAWLLEAQINLNGPDCKLLFPTPRGRLWRERTFYRDVWKTAQEVSSLDIRPHSYVTHLRAEGVNDADLARIAGHRVETMLGPIYARNR